MGEMLIQERRNRQTGTIIEVWKELDGQPGYATICKPHSQICHHDTRADALSWAAEPIVWCEICNGNEAQAQALSWEES